MKRTEIKYVKDGDGIKVININNVATFEEIAEQYGDKIAKMYIEDAPSYYLRCILGKRTLTVNTENLNWIGSYRMMDDGSLCFDADGFSTFISILKAAGNRLIEIAKANQPEEKTILI